MRVNGRFAAQAGGGMDMTEATKPWFDVRRDRLARILDWVLEYGIYLIVLSTFRSASTRALALSAVSLAWVARYFLTRGQNLDYLRHPIIRCLLLLAVVTLASIAWSPDMKLSLYAFANSLGIVVILAVIIPDVFRTPEKLKCLLFVLALVGLYLNVVQIRNHFEDVQAGVFLTVDTINFYRSFSDSLVFYLPFMLALASLTKGKASLLWWGAALLQLILLGLTGSRGAWVGVAAALTVWALLAAEKKILWVAAAGVVIVALVAVLIPGNLVASWAARGLWAAGRWEVAWTPAYHAIFDSPFFGYGYGQWVYDDMLKQLIASSPPMENNAPMGPHNNFLELWLASGVAATALLIAVYASFSGHIMRLVRSQRTPLLAYLGLATLVAFVAEYLVRGFVETVTWRHLGILLGIGLAVLHVPTSSTKKS